jgi:hypothetical protein
MAPHISYAPLDPSTNEIRLLRVEAASHITEIVQCSLSHATPAGSIYQALSYTWGDGSIKSKICLNGERIEVGISLETALRYIRSFNCAIVVWVDALCINQADLAEKASQVPMMSLIYSYAEMVIAWIGESGDDSDLAVDAMLEMDRVSKGYTTLDALFENLEKVPDGSATLAVAGIPEILHDVTLRAMSDFCSRTYWRRMWIVQELQLAQHVEVRCGIKAILLDQLHSPLVHWAIIKGLEVTAEASPLAILDPRIGVLGMENRKPLLGRVPLNQKEHIANQRSSVFGNMLLRIDRKASLLPQAASELPIDLVAQMAAMDAGNARDKIYGLLGFVSPRSPNYDLLIPNYTVPVKDSYTKFAMYAILRGRIVETLRYAGHCRWFNESEVLRREGFPTWVPDWRAKRLSLRSYLFERRPADRRRHMGHETPLGINWQDLSHPSKTSAPNPTVQQGFRFSQDRRVLYITGRRLAIIDRAWVEGLYPWSTVWARPRFSVFATDILGGPLVQGETSLHAYFRLMCGVPRSEEIGNEDAKSRSAYLREAAVFIKLLCLDAREEEVFPGKIRPTNWQEQLPIVFTGALLGHDAAIAEKEELLDLVHRMAWSKECGMRVAEMSKYASHCAYRTADGRLGLGEFNLQKGDILCQVVGHDFPFALRRERDHYVSLGECFLQDLNSWKLGVDSEEFNVC